LIHLMISIWWCFFLVLMVMEHHKIS
jgi:hypothetical protein